METSPYSHLTIHQLYDAFGTDKFDDLYTLYESDESIPKKTIGAQELILDLA